MFKKEEILSSDEKLRLIESLREIRRNIRWKPGKDYVHLKKRQRMKHLPKSASLSDYDGIISDLVRNGQNIMYLYEYSGSHYYAIRGFAQQQEWLVLFGIGGVLETAFPPENIDDYLEHRGFVLLDRIEEVLKWTVEASS